MVLIANVNLVASGNEKLQDLKALPVDGIQDSISFETENFTIGTMEQSGFYKANVNKNTDDGTNTRLHYKEENVPQARNDDEITSDIRRQRRISSDVEVAVVQNMLPGGLKFEGRLDDEVDIATVPCSGGVKNGEIETFAIRNGRYLWKQ